MRDISVLPKNVPLCRIPHADMIEDFIHRTEHQALHIHSQTALDWVLSQKQLTAPVILHIHRHDVPFYDQFNKLDFPPEFLHIWKSFISPFEEWNDHISRRFPQIKTQVIKEVPRIRLYLPENKEQPSAPSLQFGALISHWDEPFVRQTHDAVKKILITGRSLNILWILPDKKSTQMVQNLIKADGLSDHVTVGKLADLPLLHFDGLITDGNQSLSFDFFQYFYLLIACINSKKLLITLKGNPYFIDLLKDGKTCITLPDFQSNKLGHLIHFFIAFPEEIVRVTTTAKEYFDRNFLPDLRSNPFQDIYGQLDLLPFSKA